MARITFLARKSPDINQRSGVSVRVSIANYETIISNALRRSILRSEKRVSPRISDLPYIVASFSGKVELETFEDEWEPKIVEELSKKAILNTFAGYFNLPELEAVVHSFDDGPVVETSSEKPSNEYLDMVKQVGGLEAAVKRLKPAGRPELMASATEFMLEGLHLNRKLNRNLVEEGFRYRG